MRPAACGAPSQWPSPRAWRNPSVTRKSPPRSACYTSAQIADWLPKVGRHVCAGALFAAVQVLFDTASSNRKGQLSPTPFPQGVSGRVGQVVKMDPHVAAGRAGKINSIDLLPEPWQVGIDAVRVEF